MRSWWRRSPGAALMVVLALLAGSMALYLLRHERAGGLVAAVAAETAAFLRVVLPERRAGLLSARSRWFDAAFLGGLGLLILLGDVTDVYRSVRG